MHVYTKTISRGGYKIGSQSTKLVVISGEINRK